MYFISNNYFQFLQCASNSNDIDENNNIENSNNSTGAVRNNQLEDFINYLKKNDQVIYSKNIDFNNIQQPEQGFDLYQMYNNINKYISEDKLPLALEGLSQKTNQLFTNVNLAADLAPNLCALSGIWAGSPMSSDSMHYSITQSDHYRRYEPEISQLISQLPDTQYSYLNLNYLKDDDNRWSNTDFNNINAEKYWQDEARIAPVRIDVLIYEFDQNFINILNNKINEVVNEGLKKNNIITNNNKSEEYISQSVIQTITNMHLFQFLNSAPNKYGILHQFYNRETQPMLILAIQLDTALSMIKQKSQSTNFQDGNRPDEINKLITTLITILKHTLEPEQLKYLINTFAIVKTDKDKTQLVKEFTRVLIVQVLNKFMISRHITN